MTLSNRAKGLLYTLCGILVLIPDALLIRMVALEGWELLFWRSILAGFVFGLVILFNCYRARSFESLAIGWDGLLLSACMTICCSTFIIAFQYTKAANILVIIAVAPMFSAQFDRLVFKCKLPGRTWFAMVACLLGVILLVADEIGTGSQLGNFFALGDAIFLGIAFSLMGQVKSESVIPALGLGYTLPAVMAFPFITSLAVPAESIPQMLIMGLIIVPVSFLLVSKGPKYIPAPEVALFILLETVCGPLLVWIVLGVNPGRYALIGGIIVIGTLACHSAVALMQERKRLGLEPYGNVSGS
ncbi:MAG: EamA family transporter [Deltaproteobacteria bacterium]|nr:EamA family transporter [Deltaproteobacteria bacterium]